MKRTCEHYAICGIVLTLIFPAPYCFGKLDPNEHMKHVEVLRASFDRIRAGVQIDGAVGNNVVVGFATSMDKILPRVPAGPLQVESRVELVLARNEIESFQVIVLPCSEGIKRVRVRIRDLHGKDGLKFAADNIDAVPVGYVRTKAVPPYGSSHVGWWPDPILDFMDVVDIAAPDAQSFWVRVRAPKEQPPGVYEGKLEIMVEGRAAFSFDFSVRVFGFVLPDASPLPLAVTFRPHDHPRKETQEARNKWRKSQDYPVNAWKKHKLKWADFLADYYLTYDSLYSYGNWTPDFEVIEHLHEKGRLGRFNLGYFGPCGESPEKIKHWKADILSRIQPAYEKAKRLGVLDHAYIYGCDEVKTQFFDQVQRAAEILKAEFPDVMVMTTTYDNSYGLGSVIKSVDAFCPLTPRFDSGKAVQARAFGKQVWWYICCGPSHPHANMFIEYPAIEGRLLMGAMTAKYRPDGFLYYQISIWNSRKPIDTGPFTGWDPRSWTTYHGDGSWTCVGPDGTPLPTIRLENFRDGLEDYAYYRILEAAVAEGQASPELRAGRAEWLVKAKKLLVVPEELVASRTEFTDDPAVVYRYRKSLAEAIEAAGAAVAPSKDRIALKVDLALPQSEKDTTPVSGTLKPGWTPFVARRWADMYMHDATWEDGSSGKKPPSTAGLDGTGVHVMLDCGSAGNGGFAVYGMSRNNLGGGGQPTGKPKGDPIANGWFHNIDWGGERTGDILMRINGLPAGEYEMTCYHNHWEPRKQSTRNSLDQPSRMPNLPLVRAMPLPAKPLPGYRGWDIGTGTGKGVMSIREAGNIDVTSVTSDAKVAKSLIRFKTDGSNDVLVVIDGGNNDYPDPARRGREGSKAVLNAFEIIQII